MESLLACYASDDEEGEQQDRSTGKMHQNSAAAVAAAVPAPVTSKSLDQGPEISSGKGMFSFLPAPKRNRDLDYRPAIKVSDPEEADDDGNANKKKPRQEERDVTVLGRLVLPAPKKSLGGGNALGGGRGQALDFSGHNFSSMAENKDLDREDLEEMTVPSNSEAAEDPSQQSLSQGGYEDPWQDYQTQGYDNCEGSYQTYDGEDNFHQGFENQGQEDQYQYYDPGYADQAQGSEAPTPEEDPVAKALRLENRKGRAEPVKFVQIKQDDLTANRPREDQLRATGIAFGSSFSTVFDKNEDDENKPSKLHKRKHQIGSLYYEMKQKEFELMERRARGALSKSQTHAKYGW